MASGFLKECEDIFRSRSSDDLFFGMPGGLGRHRLIIVNDSGEMLQGNANRKKKVKRPKNVKFGNINVKLQQGIFYEEEVDSVVNSTSGKLNLSSGQASKALLEKAGSSMQEECNKKYPEGIESGGVAETGGHGLHCGYVFHVFLMHWKKENALQADQVFLDTMIKVLEKCDTYELDSIAIPPIGTGFVGFQSKNVAQLILKAVQDFSKSHKTTTLTDVRLVIRDVDEETYEEFEGEFGKFSYTNMQIPVIPGKAQSRVRFSLGNLQVELVRGSLTEQKVDVLVNVTNENLKLDKGALSNAILQAAGQNLQLECNNLYPNGVELCDVVVTNAFEIESVKAIYHTALPVYKKDQDSTEQILCVVIQRCLSEASGSTYQSIAFPAVGTGYHKYPSKIAAKVMTSAISDFCNNTSSTSLQKIVIVVYDRDQSWKEVWKNLSTELKREEQIRDKGAVKRKMSEACSPVQKLPVPPVIPLPEVPSSPPVHVQPKRGTKNWFQMKYEEEIHVPRYWTSVKGGEKIKRCKKGSNAYELRDVDTATHKIIQDLVLKSWEEDKVGNGRDAKNLRELQFKSLNITKIQRVENIDLYRSYSQERQTFFDKASKKGCAMHTAASLPKSKGEVRIHKLLGKEGNISSFLSDVYSEINEHYLFHGTMRENIEAVMSQGIDSRLAGDNAMFGAGVYMAESATKADQYSDPKQNRRTKDLKMLLVRATLGDIFVCSKPQTFKRAPCKVCKKDKCDCKGLNPWDFYDSVLADGDWIFREFVVYDKRQAYPEYLITYDRV